MRNLNQLIFVLLTMVSMILFTGCNDEFAVAKNLNTGESGNPAGGNPPGGGGEPGGGEPPGNGGGEPASNLAIMDNFTQLGISSSMVDVIWVVDNSGSMGNDQVNLGNNIDSFLAAFTASAIPDINMFITTTDSRASKNGGDGQAYDDVLFTQASILADIEQFKLDFKDTVMVGTGGSGQECSANGFFRANARYKNSYLRSGALKVVNIISDETDHTLAQIGTTPAAMLDSMRAEYGAGNVVVNAVVTTDINHSYYGADQIAAANATGGLVSSITSNFSSTLSNIGNQIVNLLEDFNLSQVPVDPTAIVVQVNGSAINNFTYDSMQNSININPAPANGSSIQIDYETAAPNSGSLSMN